MYVSMHVVLLISLLLDYGNTNTTACTNFSVRVCL